MNFFDYYQIIIIASAVIELYNILNSQTLLQLVIRIFVLFMIVSGFIFIEIGKNKK